MATRTIVIKDDKLFEVDSDKKRTPITNLHEIEGWTITTASRSSVFLEPFMILEKP